MGAQYLLSLQWTVDTFIHAFPRGGVDAGEAEDRVVGACSVRGGCCRSGAGGARHCAAVRLDGAHLQYPQLYLLVHVS